MRIGSAISAGLKGFSSDSPKNSAERNAKTSERPPLSATEWLVGKRESDPPGPVVAVAEPDRPITSGAGFDGETGVFRQVDPARQFPSGTPFGRSKLSATTCRLRLGNPLPADQSPHRRNRLCHFSGR